LLNKFWHLTSVVSRGSGLPIAYTADFESVRIAASVNLLRMEFIWPDANQIVRSRSVLLTIRNVSDKSCRENQNRNFMFNFFFCFENNTVYELMWKNIVDPYSPHSTVQCDLSAG
jgi:hypothetical protein